MNTCCGYEDREAIKKSLKGLRKARCNLESVMCQLNQVFDYLECGFSGQPFREATAALTGSRPVIEELSKAVDDILMEINMLGAIPFLPDPPRF